MKNKQMCLDLLEKRHHSSNRDGDQLLDSEIHLYCMEDAIGALGSLENSMNRNADASDALAKKVLWLNWILAIATVVGVAVTVIQFFKG
ncbi:MAG: hypothetical protein V2A78_02095 [bacterium]